MIQLDFSREDSHALGDSNCGTSSRGRRAAAPALAQSTGQCPNPNALGVSRTVEIDTTGGPGFGFEQYKAHDFLLLKEVVLTFDDGPLAGQHPAVLEALAEHCTKATFFPIGKQALWQPEILKRGAQARPHRRRPTPGRTSISSKIKE